MSACEETCVATLTLQGSKPVQLPESGVRLQFRADSIQDPPTRCEFRGWPKFSARQIQVRDLSEVTVRRRSVRLQSIHETSAWAPPVTLPGSFSRWSTARRVR